MNTWEAILLGLIQGITEFLPVSSSGHLEMFQLLLGLTHLDHLILFNLICHLGTLCAILIVFYPHIKDILQKHPKTVLHLALATLPLFPLVLILKPIKA